MLAYPGTHAIATCPVPAYNHFQHFFVIFTLLENGREEREQKEGQKKLCVGGFECKFCVLLWGFSPFIEVEV